MSRLRPRCTETSRTALVGILAIRNFPNACTLRMFLSFSWRFFFLRFNPIVWIVRKRFRPFHLDFQKTVQGFGLLPRLPYGGQFIDRGLQLFVCH